MDGPGVAALAGEAGAALAGLRLDDGTLILKVERGGAALQIRFSRRCRIRCARGDGGGAAALRALVAAGLRPDGGFMEGCRHPGPSRRAVAGDREIPFALDRHLAGKKAREIAIMCYGRTGVAREWCPDSLMHATIRYRRLLRCRGHRRERSKDSLARGVADRDRGDGRLDGRWSTACIRFRRRHTICTSSR